VLAERRDDDGPARQVQQRGRRWHQRNVSKRDKTVAAGQARGVRYVILGAGAVGGSIGGLLRLSGCEVAMLARGDHARVMKNEGLTLATPTGTHRIELDVAAAARQLTLRPDDVLFVTTKTQHTEALLSEVAALPVASSGLAAELLPLICAQNGVENERIALRRFHRVYGVCVMLPAAHLEPGRVEAQGGPHPGMLDVGCYPSGLDALAEEVAIDLSAAGFLSIARAEVMRWKYAKLLRNLGNAIEALCGHHLDATGATLVAELAERTTAEGTKVLDAAGIDVVGRDEWKAYRRDQVQVLPVEGHDRSGGSSWQSATRGAGSIEADFLNGEIGLLGRLHGVPTPLNDLLQREANALARDRRAPGSVPPGRLLSEIGR
jgi:2-dehydropantoate 2-reductase